MIVTIEELGYQLQPYGKGPCWQLYQFTTNRTTRKGDPLPDEWLRLEFYPTTLERGLQNIAERALRESRVTGDLDAAMAEVRRIGDAITAACAGLHPPQRRDRASSAPEVPDVDVGTK
ncbi:MAG: hypothetical protein P4L93_08215 [Coriobacteriia bacterium]|nr:hypothetical protein [Coriobacteriia bacterium]